jgi:phosphoribosyl 1,2-cyclic phosphodiesterase
MIRFLNLESGSKGNATLIYDETTLFQIDMGVPLKVVKEGLDHLGKKVEDIQGLFITHEHTDHIKTLPLLSDVVPVYASLNTVNIPCKTLTPYQKVQLGSFVITPISTSHDAVNPIGFLIEQKDEKLVYVTDTGYLSDENLALIKGATYYIIESNHDYKMLLHSHRPASLKHRIHSDVGHLSNSDSAFYMAGEVSDATKGIYLAHLSEECNTPECALETYRMAFEKQGLQPERYHIVCAKQWEAVEGGDL